MNKLQLRTDSEMERQGWMKFSPWFEAVVKYAILTVCGALLYAMAAKYALTVRGYSAIGGEGFLLLLPVIYGMVEAVIRGYGKEGTEKH